MELINPYVNVSILHDTRRTNKAGESLVKIRITHNRQRKYINSGYSFTPKKFETIMNEKARGDNKKIRMVLEQKKENVIKVINKIAVDYFTLEKFDLHFSGKGAKVDKDNFYSAMDYKQSQFEKANKFKSAQSYSSTINSLKNFTDNKPLSFADITPAFLQSYEDWIKKNGRSTTTVGIYMRNIRAAFNFGKEEGLQIEYPFGKSKYQIPRSQGRALAISPAEIRQIFDYTPETPEHAYYKDLWIFSYLNAGMNPTDIAHLKWKDIDMSRMVLSFYRRKTQHARNQKLIETALLPQSMQILQDHGTDQEPENFIFPILEAGLKEETAFWRIQKMIKQMNDTMATIGKTMDIPTKITTYTARHSYASIMKNSGAPVAFISESLGHQNISTTQNYLNRFELEKKREFTRKLL